MIIKLGEMLKEMPRTGVYVTEKNKKELENLLRVKLNQNDFFNEIDEHHLEDSYYIFWGNQQYLHDKWSCLIRKDSINNENVVLCLGSTYEQISYTGKESAFKVLLTYKFEAYPEKAASKSYIFLAKKWNTIIFCDHRLTDDAKYVWLEILTRPNLELEYGVKIIVWNKKTRKHIDPYNVKVDDIFGPSEQYDDILIGIKPA